MNPISFPPLLRRRPLLPGESLCSLLARLAVCNFYEPPGLMHHLYLTGLPDTKVERARHLVTFARLATLTKLDPRQLYQATIHPFASTLMPPNQAEEIVLLPGGHIRPLVAVGVAAKQLRAAETACYCPACLKSSAYHRLLWMPFAVAACLQHQCLLLNQCPACHQTVTVWDVTYCRCRHCQTDLTQAPSLSLADDDWGLFSQQLLQSWLTGQPSPTVAVDYGLPDQPAAVLYRVVDGLRASTMQVTADWSYFHRLMVLDQALTLPPGGRSRATPAESYLRYATACKALLNWPQGFYEFLQAYVADHGREKKWQGVSRSLGTIQRIWLNQRWDHPAFQFIQAAFDRYLIDAHPPSPNLARMIDNRNRSTLDDQTLYVSLARAAGLLKTTPAAIKRLIQRGYLTSYQSPHAVHRTTFVLRSEILTLCQRWHQARSVTQTTQQLGLSKQVVLNLAKMGWLEVVRAPHVDGLRRWTFTPQSVADYRQQVIRHVTRPPSPAFATLNLIQAIHILMPVGLDTAKILKRVADGKLPAYHPQPAQARLTDLCFTEADIRACLEAVKAENGWVTRQEIAHRMGLTGLKTISGWIKGGLLSPLVTHIHIQYFDQKVVEAFIDDHLLVHQAAKLLKIRRNKVYVWIDAGLLQPVSGPGVDGCFRYLFSRTEVERLQQHLTIPQMAQHLGLNYAQVIEQVRKGLLHPVSGPGIDDRPNYFFERPPESTL